MPTIPPELKSTYSFIDPLLADPVLSTYGDNALLLFALALYLDVEDLASFATDSLTDQPDDKKADVIYINEAEGVACIAQGYTAESWGKREAPANKASDLNTAAAWLLQRPIDEVPKAIRSHAKLLREAIQSKSVNKIIFAYAHNLMESHNVDSELQTLRHLLKGLEITKELEVEIVELGLRKIEQLYLTSLGSIQVIAEVDFQSPQVIRENGLNWKAFVLPINGRVLYDLYESHGNALFSANLRDFLGARKSARNVNNQIKTTVEKDPGRFFVLNNGITLVTKKAVPTEDGLKIHGISIVNGAQTTGAIHSSGYDHAKNVSVLARVIVVNDPEFIRAIVAGNNTQNSIASWDRRSNDPVQVRLRQEFAARGVEYVHRRDSSRKSSRSVFSDQIGQMLCAFNGDLQTAIRAKAEIFEADLTYNKVFPRDVSVGHVFAVQSLGWAYDRMKQDLKELSTTTPGMTQIQTKQADLLAFPASKQFVVRLVGELREEIAGVPLASPQSLEFRHERILADGQAATDAWLKVLKVILPIAVQSLPVVQGLPVEEYQVVRSTEHTLSVAARTKGIVAGTDIVVSSFSDLRTLLKPV